MPRPSHIGVVASPGLRACNGVGTLTMSHGWLSQGASR